jgi:hypothetical protein
MYVDGPPVHFLNLEYFFRAIYELFIGGSGSVDVRTGSIMALISGIWLVFTIIAYLFTLAAIGLFVYSTMRIYQIRKDEEALYATRTLEQEEDRVDHSRWQYITELIENGQETEWRQAIIEADIMLDELLDRLGYQGASVGEKLRAVNPAQFQTLNNAWEAHKVRNEIAHQGSAYQLPERLAHRTIANYETVFREHGEI